MGVYYVGRGQYLCVCSGVKKGVVVMVEYFDGIGSEVELLLQQMKVNLFEVYVIYKLESLDGVSIFNRDI